MFQNDITLFALFYNMRNLHIIKKIPEKNYFFVVSLLNEGEILAWRRAMKEQRRSFIKKTLGASALVAAGAATTAIANSDTKNFTSSNGVVVGKSNKKEILYKETAEWEAFYKASY